MRRARLGRIFVAYTVIIPPDAAHVAKKRRCCTKEIEQ